MVDTAEQELASFGYQQQLKRTLTFPYLLAFGLNYMVPIAPAMVFAYILKVSGGTVALPYLLAGIAMSTTALSYGILIKNFPIAGSLYSFVSRGFNPHVGFIAAWVLLLDYLLLPTVTAMATALFFTHLFPSMSYTLFLFLFVTFTGLLNLFGIDLVAKLGLWLLLIGEIIIFIGFFVWAFAVHKGLGVGHLISNEPFHFESITTLGRATSVAVLSYLGFDAITTLSEEATYPKRDIPRAIFWAVIIGCGTMFLTGYLAVLVIPNWAHLLNDNDPLQPSLFYIAKITGGYAFQLLYIFGFLLAIAIFNSVSTAAAARLLYGMGRDEVLPKKIFSAINTRYHTPHWNIIAITVMELLIGISVDVYKIFELVSYGALFGFAFINLSVVWLYFIKRQGVPLSNSSLLKILNHFVSPILGIIIMLWVFCSMQSITLIFGTIWLLIGIIYGAYRTKGYRTLPPIFHI